MNKTITPYLHFQPFINRDGMKEAQYIAPSFQVELWSANFGNLAHNRLSTHWHEAFEFALIISGKALYHFGPDYITLSAGDALFVNSAVPHSTSPFKQDLEMFTVAFPPNIFGLPGDALYEETIEPVLKSKLGALLLSDPAIIQKLQEIYFDSQKHELSFLNLSIQVLELWSRLTVYLQQPEIERKVIPKSHSREEIRLKKCIAFIRQNWQNPITIDEISNSASISRNTCFRLFKKYLHVTPLTYINHFRISHAELMLLETERSVADIAFACGYNSVIYFDRVFRQFHGKTPQQYRQSER